MKRLLLILLTSILCLSVSAQKKQKHYNLLWQIKGKQSSEPSFLFGTMHVADERAFNYSDSVMLAIDKADAFALEAQPDEMVSALFSEMFTSSDTTNLVKDILTKEEYEQLAKRVEAEMGIPLDQLNLNNPLLIEIMLERSHREFLKDSLNIGYGTDMSTFVDAYLNGIAKTLDKNIYGLEKIDDQLAIFTNISKEEQRKSLLRSIDTTMGKKVMMRMMEEQLIKVYNEGNIEKIEQFVGKKWIEDSVMVKRNHVMAESIDSILQKENLFAAVGAAHLPGEKGVIKLLEAKGYQLSPVKATFTGVADQYKIDYSNQEWETYTDNESGFSVETPAELFEFNMFEKLGMDMHFTWEMTSGAYYGIIKIPVPSNMEVSEAMEDLLYQSMSKNFAGAGKEVILNEVIETQDGKAAELIYKDSNSTQRMRFYYRYGKMTALFMGNNLEVIKQPFADRFFDSFKSFEPENYEPPKPVADFDPSSWVDYKNEQQAFSIKLPNLDVTDQSRELEVEGATDKYVVEMFFATDTIARANYFVRYNDFPLGMYAQAGALDETLAEMRAQADEFEELDTLWQNGFEGRSFKMTNKGFPMTGRIFVRGNRIYGLIQQLFLPAEQQAAAGYFFDSFKLEPYLQDTFQTVKSDTFFYKIDIPSINKTTNSTDLEDYKYYGFESDHTLFGKNPYTGAMHMLYIAKYNDLYRIFDIDSFYNQLAYGSINYADTILQQFEVEKNGVQGMEYHISADGDRISRRLQYFLNNQYLYQLDAYDTNEELFGDKINHFFDSFEIGDVPNFDMQTSKTSTILKGLQSNDEQTYEKSLYALTSYYEFIEEDIDPLFAAAKLSYPIDTANNVATSIFNNLEPLLKDEHVPQLTDLYRLYKDSTYLSSDILNAINKLDTINGYETYFNLMVNETPKESNYYTYAPLNDSLPYVADHFDQLLPLLKNDAHRLQIVGIANTLHQYKNDLYKNKIEKYIPNILEYAMEAVEAYKTKPGDLDHVGMLEYLTLIDAAENAKLGEKFTKNMLQTKLPIWSKVDLAEYRLKNNLKIKSKLVDTLLANEYTKLRTIKALYKAGKTKLIPKKDLAFDAFTQLAFNNCLNNYDEYFADSLSAVGKLNKKDGDYYVYQFNYDDQEKQYFGIIGPFEGNSINFDYQCKTKWDIIEEDWQAQAEQLLNELKAGSE